MRLATVLLHDVIVASHAGFVNALVYVDVVIAAPCGAFGSAARPSEIDVSAMGALHCLCCASVSVAAVAGPGALDDAVCAQSEADVDVGIAAPCGACVHLFVFKF